jgi:WS/DGAT/MGAT family acyltransferase
MVERLSPLDSSFLFMEGETTAMHVGGLMTFEPAPDADLDAFVRLIGERLAAVPRYRQKIREVPVRLGLPVWVDDTAFDLGYHVRRSALPAPGTDAQLRELVGRLQGRPLDRSRPLWEIYLVEGLADGGFAIITKTHHAMVDGLSSIDIGAVLLDLTPAPRPSPPDTWDPAPEPSSLGLAVGAVVDQLKRPQHVVDTVRRGSAPSTGNPTSTTAARSTSSCRGLPTRLRTTPATRTAGSKERNPCSSAARLRDCPRTSTTSTTGAPSSPATCAVDPAPSCSRPSNRPITPSTTAISAPAAPCRASGRIRSSPTSTGSRLRPGRPVASAW